jgi:acyl phosphate:glycerol-3-phosphate acyltransferase
MTLNTTTLTAILIGYLCGAIPCGLIVGRIVCKVDIRREGSGNLGATNAIRVLGWGLGILVLVLDISKGILPLLLLKTNLPELEAWLPALGAAAIIGHVFPIFLKFKGGKGVATAAGVILLLHPQAFLIALSLFLITVAATRYVSLASLVATTSLLISYIVLDGPNAAFGTQLPKTLFFILTSTIVFTRHLGNIKRLAHGTESKLGDGPKNSEADLESENGV